MDWEDRLDDWELELDLAAQLEGSDWVTLERAAAETGASRAALRTWYRTGQIPSRLVDGPHGPQRLVPLALVAARAEASPRLRSTAERRLADEAQLEILRHRIDQLELRLAALEQRQPSDPPTETHRWQKPHTPPQSPAGRSPAPGAAPARPSRVRPHRLRPPRPRQRPIPSVPDHPNHSRPRPR